MKFNNFRSKLADDLEIPNDAMSDNFNMRLHGNNKAIIENHTGITVYEETVVGIKTKEGTIIVRGRNFKIEEINDFKVIVKGVIEEIKINSKG